MHELDALFAPRGIAIIGASQDRNKLGFAMGSSLSEYSGEVRLVNSRASGSSSDFFGTAAEAASAMAAGLDLAILCVPASACSEAAAEAARAGAKAIMVCAGGFAESGDEGSSQQQRLMDVVRQAGIRLLGPNTSGFFRPSLGLTASFVPAASSFKAGNVAVVASSGGVNHAISLLLAKRGVGLSLGVGMGNSPDITAADVLDYLHEDTSTGVVALHLESVSEGARLMSAVRKLVDRVPVVALVVGKSDVSQFAASHTGALSTSWETMRAALRQSGAVLVEDERELVDAVVALSKRRIRGCASPGVGIVTAQAGPGLLLLDALRNGAVLLPELTAGTKSALAEMLPPITFQGNPVDTGRPSPHFPAVVKSVADDPGIDVVGVYALSEPGAIDFGSLSDLEVTTPMLLGVGSTPEDETALFAALAASDIATYDSPAGLAVGIRAIVEDAQQQFAVGRDDDEWDFALSAPEVHATLDEMKAKALLDALGVRTPARLECSTSHEAHAALDALGAPVVMKCLDASVLHKTDIGGVVLGVRSHNEVDEAVRAFTRRGFTRFLVEEMVGEGVELIVGVKRDAVFGHVVLVGLGGSFANVLQDVSIGIAPLSRNALSRMIDGLKGTEVLDGFRGLPAVDREELVEVLARIAVFAVSQPRIETFEINPLRMTSTGLVALDAVVTAGGRLEQSAT